MLKKIYTAIAVFAFLVAAGQSNAQTSQRNYYVDCIAGNDSNTGLSAGDAWRTVSRANSASLSAGDKLLFAKSCTWRERLNLSRSGTREANIYVGSYGTGALPKFTNNGEGAIVDISGSYITIDGLHASAIPTNYSSACQNNPVGFVVGFSFRGGSSFNTVKNSRADGGYAGAYVREGSTNNIITKNVFEGNIMMNPLDASSDNDAGAFGVLLAGDNNEISSNIISGHDACSIDYGRDGAAVEVYGGRDNIVKYNYARQNDAFTELGNSRSSGNIFSFNVFESTLNSSIFLVTRGASSGYGPVTNTIAFNNTVYLTGSSSQGFVCHAGCGPDILTFKNNIIWSRWKVGYADNTFNSGSNIYYVGQRQFSLGPNDITADPQFVDPSAGDFHLKAGSPGIDSGDLIPNEYHIEADIEGGFVPTGNGVDRGAFEFGSEPGGAIPEDPGSGGELVDGDTNGDGVVDERDAAVLIERWGNEATNTGFDQYADGFVNSLDFAKVLSAVILPTPTPTTTVTPAPTPAPTQSPTSTPSPTPPPAGGSVTLTPQEDSFVDADRPSQSFGSLNALEVDGRPLKSIYMKFDARAVTSPSFISAVMKVRTIDGSNSTQRVRAVDDNSWSESTLVYNNRPAMGAQVASVNGTFTGSIKEIDITDYVRSRVGTIFSLGLDADSSQSDGFDFNSSESSNPPELVITYSTSTPTPTPVVSPTPTPTPPPPGQGGEVVFGAVGDHGTSSSRAGAVFQALGAQNLDFFVSLGDLSYQEPSSYSESRWCQFVKDNINIGAGFPIGSSYGEFYPFQIIAGGHENGVDNPDGFIDNFVQCLPDRMSSVVSPSGKYGREYYFDYPADNPMVRVIATSPNLNYPEGRYTVTSGNARYNWIAQAIDSAKARGLWVIAVNHENFITTGIKSNETGPDYFNLLVSRGVDLILQGHEHNVQRSHALKFNAQCTSISPSSSANTSCISDSGADARYARGAGSVLVINGTGGIGFYSTSSSDAQNPYFAKWMGNTDTERTNGFYKFSISPARISAEFIRGAGGNFSDSFLIE